MRIPHNPVDWNIPIPRPAHFDVAGYQEKIDRITGLAHGRPIIMLRWTWDVHETYFRGTKFEEEVWEYASKWEAGKPFIAPRWVLHQRYERNQYVQSWEASRYIQDPETGEIMDRGEAPPEFYKHLATLTVHDAWCCEWAKNRDKAKCVGADYRSPDEEDLDALRRQRREHDLLPSMNPHEPLSNAEVEAAYAEANGRVQEKEAQLATYRKARWADFIKDYGHKGPGHGGRGPKVNYSMPTGFEASSGGILIPKG